MMETDTPRNFCGST